MASTELLTHDDLDRIGSVALTAAEPLGYVNELVGAVDQGRLADGDDAGYALSIAAELAEKADVLDTALALAQRAVAAYEESGRTGDGYARARLAELLHRSGYTDEAAARFGAMRPLLSTDELAANYLVEAMEAAGLAGAAEEWLTDALRSFLIERPADAEADADTDTDADADTEAEAAAGRQARMITVLARTRHRVRHELGLPHDDLDDLAETISKATAGLGKIIGDDGYLDDDGEQAHHGTAVMFWPRAAFDVVAQRWPELTEPYHHDWDEHRTSLERGLTEWSAAGRVSLALLAGDPDELAQFAALTSDDPVDIDVRQEYAEVLADEQREVPWPPGRNEPCWCGSGAKYKKCCRPRAHG